MSNGKQKKRAVVEAPDASGKISRKQFEEELAKLQVELARLQTWVKDKRARVIVVFEGRDTAGKGGVISRITERTSPRVFRHIALPAPSDREKHQVYIQRYIAQFPTAGEIILFDRSWYNRAGVERVMGFCTDEQYERFMANRQSAKVVLGRVLINRGTPFEVRYAPDSAAKADIARLPRCANGQISHPACLNSCPYLRAIALICSRVNSFRGSPGRLQVSRKKPSRPGGTMIHSRTSS